MFPREATRSRHVVATPRGPARAVVRRYVGHEFRGLAPGFHRGLPSRSLTFRFSLGRPEHIAVLPDRRQPGGHFEAFAGGLHTSPALVSHPGHGMGIGVEFPLSAAKTLFRVPPAALAGAVVDLADLVGAALAGEIVARLNRAATWPARFAVLDDVLGRLPAHAGEARAAPEVAAAWQRIVRSGGTAAITEVAGEVGWSRRHLTTRFRNAVGLAPKALARVVRFERAGALLLTSPHRSLADVATACGYYDQAHLNRDWLDLAGCSPTAWLAEEMHDPVFVDDGDIPFVQDLPRAGP